MPIDPYAGPANEPLNLVQAAFESFGISPTANADLFDRLYNEAKKALAAGATKPELYPAMLELARQTANPGVPREFSGVQDPATAAGGGAGGAGGITDGGYSYGDLKDYLENFQTRGLIQVGTEGSPYILLKDDNGKTVLAYEQDPATGRYYGVSVPGSGGSGGGTGSASTAARDLLAQQNFEREGQQFDRTFGENQRQFNERIKLDQQQLGEGARQFDASNQRMNLSDVGQLGLQLGNLSLEQQKYIGQILREPADFLARAFSQRGGQSPFPEVTQADLINKLRSEFDRIRGFTGTEMQNRLGGAAGLGGVAPKPFQPVPQQQAPRIDMGAPLPISQTGYPGLASIAGGTPAQQNYDPVQGMPEDPANYAAIAENANNLFQPDASGQDFNFFVDEGGTLRAEPRARGTMTEGPVRDRISLVGEEGPEMLFNHGDGSFDIANNEQTMDMLNSGMIDVPGLMDRASDVTVTEHKDGTKSKRQIRFLLSKGSPLSGGQKDKLKDELHTGEVKAKGYRGGTLEAGPRINMGGDGGIYEDDRMYDIANAIAWLTHLADDPDRPHAAAMREEQGGARFVEDAELDPSQVEDRRDGVGDRLLALAKQFGFGSGDGIPGNIDINRPMRAAGYAGGTMVGSKKREEVEGYAEGTLSNLTPDVLGRLSLFDVAGGPQVTQQQLLANAQMATPPGVAAVAGGQMAPDLNVTQGSSFKLFSPTQYMSLTPDEQAALSTRLASENKSLGDFLYASQKNFVGRPRSQPRARFDVTA